MNLNDYEIFELYFSEENINKNPLTILLETFDKVYGVTEFMVYEPNNFSSVNIGSILNTSESFASSFRDSLWKDMFMVVEISKKRIESLLEFYDKEQISIEDKPMLFKEVFWVDEFNINLNCWNNTLVIHHDGIYLYLLVKKHSEDNRAGIE